MSYRYPQPLSLELCVAADLTVTETRNDHSVSGIKRHLGTTCRESLGKLQIKYNVYHLAHWLATVSRLFSKKRIRGALSNPFTGGYRSTSDGDPIARPTLDGETVEAAAAVLPPPPPYNDRLMLDITDTCFLFSTGESDNPNQLCHFTAAAAAASVSPIKISWSRSSWGKCGRDEDATAEVLCCCPVFEKERWRRSRGDEAPPRAARIGSGDESGDVDSR